MKISTNVTYVTAMTIATAVILFIYTGCSTTEDPQKTVTAKMSVVYEPAVELKTNMRKLWEDHIVWTRNVIFCLVDDLPGADQAVKRLLQNQLEIGDALKPYYGEEAGKKLTELLYPHITIAAEVIKAAKAGNAGELEQANKRWYANAYEISEFLSKANPNWVLADMKMMMNDHLRLTYDETLQRLNQDYAADVVAYDRIHKAILIMADMLTEGIIKQFPDKFKTGESLSSSK